MDAALVSALNRVRERAGVGGGAAERMLSLHQIPSTVVNRVAAAA